MDLREGEKEREGKGTGSDPDLKGWSPELLHTTSFERRNLKGADSLLERNRV